MDNLSTILDNIGRVYTAIAILITIGGVYAWFKGILPALLRLGNGLAKRKIAIFAKGDNSSSLVDLLLDSKLFSRNNLIQVSKSDDIGKGEEATLYLIYWNDWDAEIENILKLKQDGTALIVYAPQKFGSIPKEKMELLNSHRNVIVSNFRGRLLNDVIVSMITTSYEK